MPDLSAKPLDASPAPRAGREPRIICLANQKGGVGKTTTAINLGTALAAIGEAVLLIDLDPQGNASTGLGVARDDRAITSFDVLTGEAGLAAACCETAVPNLTLIPAGMDLLGIDVALADNPRRSFALADALAASGDALHKVSYVLIDCPPSLNLLTLNAMGASQSVLVPLQCEFFALEGLSQLMEAVEHIRKTLNPALTIQGIVLTMYDARNNLSAEVAADVRAHFGDLVYDNTIPRNVRISEAPSYGKPALLHDHRCAGSLAYMKLASEFVRREQTVQIKEKTA